MFIDTATITVCAGRGGDGAVSFHREKYIAAGGPDGGDGGRGGHVVLQVDEHLSTLMDFRYKRKYTAQNGAPGSGKRCSGKDGADTVIRVPRGTVVRDRESGAVVQDMCDDTPFVLARGGRGGWGNKRFATATRQCPRFAKAGLEGESREVTLELKLLADVGLVGLPNAGKSSLLSVISAARPKIADYPFTTLTPHLGVVRVDEGSSFVAADIPGLIEGASGGAGLGHEFLRHVDRCRLLVHVVDVTGDIAEDFARVQKELTLYSGDLAARPQLIVLNKCDLLSSDYALQGLEHLPSPPLYLSAATRQGVDEFIRAVARALPALPPMVRYEPVAFPDPEPATWTVDTEPDGFRVDGEPVVRLMRNINFSDYESRMVFDRTLRRWGVYAELEAKGLKDGDTLHFGPLEFEYRE